MNPVIKDLIINIFTNDFYDDEDFYTFDDDIYLSDATEKLIGDVIDLKHLSATSLYINFIENKYLMDYYDSEQEDYIRIDLKTYQVVS